MVIGVDEVGRGCWAGPLVAGAVALPDGFAMQGLKDSKLLSGAARTRGADIIKQNALGYGLGWAEPAEIDELGLTLAVRTAMLRALACISRDYEEIIIDGNVNFLADNPLARAEVKADGSVPSVSAASIVAKVARDEFMARAAREFPAYKFERHVGYGTRLHREMLRLHGVCRLHRRSYKPVKEFLS